MSNNNKSNNGNQPVKFPSEDVIKQMLENEGKKLALQERKFALEEANQKRQYDFACKSLDVQKEILKDKPKEQRKTITRVAVVGGVLTIVLLAFFGYCLHLGKEQVVMDILKYGGTALVSFFGGTYYGKNKKGSDTDSTDNFDSHSEVEN